MTIMHEYVVAFDDLVDGCIGKTTIDVWGLVLASLQTKPTTPINLNLKYANKHNGSDSEIKFAISTMDDWLHSSIVVTTGKDSSKINLHTEHIQQYLCSQIHIWLRDKHATDLKELSKKIENNL